MPESEDQRFEMLFSQIILSLNETTLMQLGKLINPSVGKAEKNLDQAQRSIDLMRMLKYKTRNNLNPREQKLLDQVLSHLQMNYVYEKEQVLRAEAAAAEGEPPLEPRAESPSTNEDHAPGRRPGQNN